MEGVNILCYYTPHSILSRRLVQGYLMLYTHPNAVRYQVLALIVDREFTDFALHTTRDRGYRKPNSHETLPYLIIIV